MNRKTRKLVLNRETLRELEDRSLAQVGGASHYNCTAFCDTNRDCSSICRQPSDVFHACA